MLKDMLKKEFRQFRRNTFLPRLVVVFPLLIMLLMPLVANMEVRNVNVAIVDNDSQDFSRLFTQRVQSSQYLTLEGIYHSYEDALRQVERCDADVIVEIPYGYERAMRSAEPKKISVWANAVNGTKGSLGMQYVLQTLSGAHARNVSVRYLFNTMLNYRYFMIPALMIMLIIMICGFLPALNLVGEKEKCTIEQINVTPVGKFTFTLGKLLPYWIIGMFVITLAMLIAWLVYGLVPRSGVGTVYLAALIFIIFMSSVGVGIANVSDNMQQVMFVMFFFVVVFILMSGLMTPVQSMPRWAQTLTYAIPPRYFIDIIRASYLRGAGIADQWQWFGILTAFAAVFAAIATVSYKKQA